MTCQYRATINCVHLIAVLALLLPAAQGDDSIEAQVQQAQLVGDSEPTPGPVGFTLKYDVRFINRSEEPVSIPDPGTSPVSTSWITVQGVEYKQPDDSWKFIVSPGMLAWKGDTKFSPCRTLAPKQAQEFMSVSGPLVLYSGQLARLGSKPTVRAGLILICRQQDGSLFSTSMRTDPFTLLVPQRP
jgi:hypothetical protein